MRKRKNAGVKGEYLWRKANLKRIFLIFLSWRLKRKVIRDFFLENEKYFQKI